MSPGTRATRAYFETVYPSRDSPLNGIQFRLGERERISAVRTLLYGRDCSEVLDVGCGDGVFLHAVLPPEARRVRVEDIVPARVSEAAKRVQQRERVVEAAIADINAPPAVGTTFDVVIAVGVLDYNPDWHNIIPRLLRRSRGTLIVDFPNAACVYAENRRAWLRSHGLECRYIALGELQSLLGAYAHVVVKDLQYNWLVRIGQ